MVPSWTVESYASWTLWRCIYIFCLQSFCTEYLSFHSYSFTHSFIYVTWLWIFTFSFEFKTDTTYIYFVQIVITFAIGSSFSWFRSPFDITSSFCSLNTYLISDTKNSILDFYCIPYPNPRICLFLRSLVSFYWRLVLETKMWALGVLTAPGESLFLCLPSWQLGNILTCINTHIYKYFSLCIHLNLY